MRGGVVFYLIVRAPYSVQEIPVVLALIKLLLESVTAYSTEIFISWLHDTTL